MSVLPAAAQHPIAEESLERYRAELVAANAPTVAVTVFAVTVLYVLSQLIMRPAQLHSALIAYLLQLAIPPLAATAMWTGLRRYAQEVFLCADLAYTACLTAQLLVPETSTSGTIVFLCLKLMATALFFPWSVRFQYASAAVTVVLYWACLAVTGRPFDETPRSHHYVAIAIAAVLSGAGAARADRGRRDLFHHNAEREELLARLQLVLERMPIGCIINDADFRYTYWNPAAERIFGYRLDDVRGKHPLDLITPNAQQETLQEAMRLLQSGQVIGPARVENLTKDGRSIVCEWNSAPLRRRDGTFVGMLSMCQDVTSRQRDEEEKHLLLEELRAANRLKSDFVATMSHELRTPLNVILGYHDLLQEQAFGSLGKEQAAVLQRMRQSATELLELINATLDVSRLDSGRVTVEPEHVAIAELITQVDLETQEMQNKPGVRVEWQVSPELPRLHSDPAKLKIILKNLLNNALKFTERGSVVVGATAHDGGVELQVADTGVGIAPEALPIIFEPFRQIGDSPTRQHGGVGLGLYIVRRLVDMIGAKLTVDSEPGHGTTFRVWVPINVGVAAADEHDAARTG
ncbi:MAG TPA: PAS domain-containing sensor histidine kinase [Candidatus Binatia bacterium]|nr:PAS domain-containing sensor histidine kinase [Candidatus Binatia bacterium]